MKTFEELKVGDRFITEDWNGKPITLTVEEKTDDGLVIPKELGGIDIFLEYYYVIND